MMSAGKIALTAILLGAWGTQCLASVQVTPSNVNLKPGQSIQFSATGDPYNIYLWGLSGSGCSGVSCGMITSSGYYTAPSVAPATGSIIVTATSWVDLSQSGTATVTVGSQSVISVQVSPPQVSLDLGQQQLFTATVTNTTNTAVTWSVSGLGCSGSTCGFISNGGVYSAPAVMPANSLINVKATSVADPSKSGTATVNLFSPITVSVSPPTVSLYPNAIQHFTAQVTGSSVTGVTWSVSGAGCSGTGCGMITSAGYYTAPATVPNNPMITVKATSTVDPNSFGTAVVTVLTPLSVTISPKSVAILSGAQVQFHDAVTGTTNTAVTWSVSGTSCSGSACGTISSTGLYSSPANLPAPMSVTVTVTLTAKPSVKASATVSILRANNAKLSGNYAFLFTGYDKGGPRQMVGSIVTDGKGKITSGYEDVNDIINPATQLAIYGTYQIRSDNRGSMTLVGPLGTQTLDLVLNSDGSKGKLISFDQTGIRGSGTIYRQDTSAFDPAKLLGGYVLSLSGQNSTGSRIGALGLIFPDGLGFISGSSLDVNEAGVAQPTFATFSGNYDIDASGRGTMTLNISGFKSGVFNFVFYVVSESKLLLLSIDPLSPSNPMFSGPVERQSLTSFSSAQFVGSAVFSLSGKTRGSGDVTVGRIQFTASNAIRVNCARNTAGTVKLAQLITGAYGVQLNGRVELDTFDHSNGSIGTWLIYATGTDSGYLLDMSSAAVRIGEITPQIALPFNNASLVGTFMVGTGEPITTSAPLTTGYWNFDGSVGTTGSGAVSGMEDISLPSSLQRDQAVSGTYSISPVSNNGQGSVLLKTPANTSYQVWVAGPTKALILQVDSTALKPTVLSIEQ